MFFFLDFLVCSHHAAKFVEVDLKFFLILSCDFNFYYNFVTEKRHELRFMFLKLVILDKIYINILLE